jgi:type I restriction-modification system DNA methylase subunit
MDDFKKPERSKISKFLEDDIDFEGSFEKLRNQLNKWEIIYREYNLNIEAFHHGYQGGVSHNLRGTRLETEEEYENRCDKMEHEHNQKLKRQDRQRIYDIKKLKALAKKYPDVLK